MTVTLFANTDYKGDKQSFAKNKSSLKDTKVGNNPSSIKITGDEPVLLFKKEDWKGGVLYVKGPRNVCDLGSKKSGGKSGFKNGITSLRRTPFTLNLNVTIVKNSKGEFPGDWGSESHAESSVGKIVGQVNRFYSDCGALLNLSIAHCTFRTSDDKFVVRRGGASYPGSWKRSNEIDVVFVHDFKRVGVSGKGKPPAFGEAVTVAAMVDYTDGTSAPRSINEIARSLAHEIGHYCGIHHPSAKGNKNNLMYKASSGGSIFDRFISADQIEEMHTTLSKNLFRKGDR
mgnify:CR=1 FL=1